jgi:(p)ppGpp synthase/HD superfamily hydrolase
MKAQWEKTDKPGYPVRIIFGGHSMPQLLPDIIQVFQTNGAQILSQKMQTVGKAKTLVKGEFLIEITSLSKLEKILVELQNVNGITYAERSLAR